MDVHGEDRRTELGAEAFSEQTDPEVHISPATQPRPGGIYL